MVMRREQRACPNGRRVVQIFRDGPRQRQSVERARSTADFVQNDEARRRRIVQNVRCFNHFHHERALAAADVVRRADTREDAIRQADDRMAGRNEAAHLGHDRQQRHLTDIRRFTGHVRACDQRQLRRPRVQFHVVRHERFVHKSRIQNRMAAVVDFQNRFFRNLWADILPTAGYIRQRREAVDRRQRPRAGLNRRRLRTDFFPKLLEQFIFQRLTLFIRPQDFVFDFLQFRRDETLAIHDRLLPHVFLRNHLQIRLRDFYEITEHLVETHFKTLDAGAFNLLRLIARDPVLSFRGSLAVFVQLRVIAVAEDAALLDGDWRLIDDRLADKFRQFRKFDDIVPQFVKQFGFGMGQDAAQAWKLVQTTLQNQHVAAIRVADVQPCHDAFQIADGLQQFTQFRQQHRRTDQILHCVQPFVNGHFRTKRPQNPFAQKSRAHRRNRLIQNGHQRVALSVREDRFHQFQIPLADAIDDHAVVRLITGQRRDMRCIAPQVVLRIMKHGARRRHRRIHAAAAETVQRRHAEVSAQQILRDLQIKHPILQRRP